MILPSIDRASLHPPEIDWSGLNRRFLNPGELETLISLVHSVNPRNVLEIGVNEGRTARAILDNVPGIELYQGVDVAWGYITEKPVQRNEIPRRPGWMATYDPRFELIIQPHGSLDLSYEDLNPADAIFIDGDHGAIAVRHDILLARSLVNPGGIVIWHDYHDIGNVDVMDILDAEYASGAKLTHVSETWLAFERH